MDNNVLALRIAEAGAVVTQRARVGMRHIQNHLGTFARPRHMPYLRVLRAVFPRVRLPAW